MADTLKTEKLKTRDLAYYRRRQQNRVFAEIARLFAAQAELGLITKKSLAEKLGRDPAQVTRWLSEPSNLELDSISDLLLAMDAELDVRALLFNDAADAQDAHPLIAEIATRQQVSGDEPDAAISETTAASEPAIKVRTTASSST